MHLWAPSLATDRVRRERPDLGPDTPLATFAKTRSALRLMAVDAAAARLGLTPGVTVKDARRIAPALVTAPHEPQRDAALRRRILARCRRFTPSLAESEDALTLDVTGAGPMFGGEAALAARALAVFRQERVAVRVARADSPAAARVLARFTRDADPHPVSAPGETRSALAPLPMEALRRPDDEAPGLVEDLTALGLRTLGEAMAWPRDTLSEVMGETLWLRLDELLGVLACPLAVALEPLRIFADRRLTEAVGGAPAVLHHVRRLAETVRDQLQRRRLGGRAFRLSLFGTHGLVRAFTVRARRPLADPVEITALFARKLEALGEASGASISGGSASGGLADASEDLFDHLRLEALEPEPVQEHAGDLWGEPADAAFEAFASSLQARFGPDVLRAIVRDPRTAKPESETRLTPLEASSIPGKLDAPAPPPPSWGDAVLRPLRLFHPPEPIRVLSEPPDQPPFTFVWRRLCHVVVRAEGPERLAPEWGREPAGARTRDYYRVEDARGHRFWIYREGFYEGGAHGEAPGAPRWYLHGLFA